MHQYRNAGYSPLPAPLDPTATYYQLSEVRAIRPQQASHLAPEALVYFTEIRQGDFAVLNAKRILQPISMQLATMLIPGTIWSANGQLVSKESNAYAEQRTLKLGRRAPTLRRLVDLFPLEKQRPLILRDSSPDTWYAVVNGENEKILIPCFELLRAFYYKGTGRLSNYFFSRLPLNVLCWPIAEPTANNSFTAHFCVAFTSLQSQEARVLASLLFDSHYRHAIEESHAYLAAAWHACETAGEAAEAYSKVNFKLGREVETEANGISFSIGKQNYFWVSHLTPLYERYVFRRVIYHPLGDEPEGTRIYSAVPQPAFWDMMRSERPIPKTMPAAELPDSFKHFGFKHFGRRRQYDPATQDKRTPVIQAFQWARRLPAKLPPVFADNHIFSHLWSRPGNIPAYHEGILPDNPRFKQALAQLRQYGCVATLLEVNNPTRRFGPGRSTFPYVYPPFDLTHLPDGRHRPLSIARIQWGGGNFYLFNFLEDDKIVLFYHKGLFILPHKVCNNLLITSVDVNSVWKSMTQNLPYIENYIIIPFDWESNNTRTLDSIYGSIKHAISYYNLSINYNNQVDKLDSLQISSVIEREKLIDEILSNIHKIYYPGNYIGEPFRWESDKKYVATYTQKQ